MGETISRRHPPLWWIQLAVLSCFRWLNERTRSFDLEYPHRLQMTEDEKARVDEREHLTNQPAALWALAPSLVPPGLVRAGAHSAELDARAAMALRSR